MTKPSVNQPIIDAYIALGYTLTKDKSKDTVVMMKKTAKGHIFQIIKDGKTIKTVSR